MTIITTQVTVNDKNIREVNTQNGTKQVISAPILKDKEGNWLYASAWLNFQVNQGDILLISGPVERKEEGQYINYNFKFPTVEKLWRPDNQQGYQAPQQNNGYQQPQQQPNPFGGGQPVNITDEDLPF